MSYLALARKWRPSQFDQVVGQAHVLTALENALNQNKLHHAYLFSGTRGVGKTTIGRLLAKGLNCETGITSTPCGQCSTCREIDEGRFVDLLEIDAASRTKVEDTRELLDNVQYKPARGRFKVYLIDEVHMLSRHSFNALLKTLEEPPEYVKFLLATTDPQKLPVTILSRCLQFHLKPISADDIHEQLDFILKKENVSAEPRALGMLSHAADGSMRDALSLTDQAIALGNGDVSVATVSTMLGSLDTDQAIHLLEAISTKQVQTAMSALNEFSNNGVDWEGLLKELATQLHRVAMYQALPGSLDKSRPDAEKIELLSGHLSPQDVQLCYQIATKGREELALAPTERIGLEMVVLRMMAFRPAVTSGATKFINTSAQQEPDTEQAIPVKPTPEQPETLHKPAVEAAPAQPNKAPVDVKPAAEIIQPVQAPTQHPKAPVVEVSGPSYDDLPTYDEEDYQPVPEQYQDVPAQSALVSQPAQGQSSPVHQQQASQQQVNQQQVPSEATRPSSVGGLRHQLRSRRASSGQAGTSTGRPEKKSKAASPSSVLERVAQKHGTSGAMPQNPITEVQPKADNEPYQWKPTQPTVTEQKQELTPTEIKQALEHTKTPEMVEKLVKESVEADKWSALIQRLNTAKLVEQLALNSAFSKQGNTIALSLRAQQAHLNTDKAQSELLEALNQALGEECTLTIEVGTQGKTPLEIREELYQGKLQSAHQSLAQDPNVEFIVKRFAAELDSDSVRPI
ncbi:DNA polymerase III subunit gamma/tau [Vibrio hannami]|uniref:DNA polymerase III subunit gamma/tau n=1 Tax=Vibrio hannami TaxID=2717094 RepID=UPI003EB95279